MHVELQNGSKMHPESSQKPSKNVTKKIKEKSLKNDSKGARLGVSDLAWHGNGKSEQHCELASLDS